MTGMPIQIRIDEHTMEISNSCILPEDWTDESLMSPHKSMPYNPTIAKVFYRMGYIENWGRGIQKIVAACDELGAPRPEYQVLGYGITLTLHALESAVIHNRMETSDSLKPADSSEVPINVPINVSINEAHDSLDERILQHLKLMPTSTYDELALSLSVNRRTIQRHVVALQNAGRLRREGSRKTGRWEVME